MFKNEYQGGSHFEIFTVHGKDPVANWKITGGAGVRKAYDKEVKSFVYNLEGSVATTKMQLPKDSRQSLTLIQRYLIFQLYLPKGQDFSMELGLTDLQNNKRRLFFSTSHKEVSLTPLHAKIPLTVVRRSIWINLCLDMVSLVGETWRGQTYKATESISLSANCKLRKIFTMKVQPPDDDDIFGNTNSGEVDNIPRQFQIPQDVSHCTQVLSMLKVRNPHGDVKKSSDISNRPSSAMDIDLSASSSRRQGQEYHIAFGSKVPVPTVSSAGKKPATGKDGSISSRKSLSKSRSDELNGIVSSRETSRDEGSSHEHLDEIPIEPCHYRFGSDPGTQFEKDRPPSSTRGAVQTWSGGTNRNDEKPFHAPHPPNEEKQFVTPHPPSGPSNDRTRRRVHRVKSANKEKLAQNQNLALKDVPYDDTSISSISCSYYSKSSSYKDPSISVRPKPSHDIGLPDHRQQLRNEDDNHERSEIYNDLHTRQKENDIFVPDSTESKRRIDHSLQDDYDEELGIINDSGPSEEEEEEGEDQKVPIPDVDHDDSMDAVIQALKEQAARIEVGSEEENEDGIKNSYEDSDDERTTKKSYNADVYMYHSPPKPANRRKNDDEQRSLSVLSNLSHHSVVLSAGSSRGARPADDFHRTVSSEDDDEFVLSKPSRLSPNHLKSHRKRSPLRNRSPLAGEPDNLRKSDLKQNGESSASASNNEEDTDEGQRSRPQLDPQAYKNIVMKHNKAMNSKNSMKLHKSSNTLSVTVPEEALLSPSGSQSRHSISKKKVREISKNDARLSQANMTSEKLYNEHKYEMGEVTDSFEARMLASLKRQADESAGEEDDEFDEAGPLRKPRKNNAAHDLAKHEYGNDDSLSSSDEDTTSFSTWKSPVPTLLPHRYQDEMHLPSSRTSQDTLGSSNPRDWSGVFSPPIVLPSDMTKDQKPEDLSPREPSQQRQTSSDSKNRSRLNSQGETAPEQETDEEDELDLLYDPCLNCYFDPKSCRYYELV